MGLAIAVVCGGVLGAAPAIIKGKLSTATSLGVGVTIGVIVFGVLVLVDPGMNVVVSGVVAYFILYVVTGAGSGPQAQSGGASNE